MYEWLLILSTKGAKVPRKKKKNNMSTFSSSFQAQLFDLSCYLGGKLKNRRNKFGVEATGRQKPYSSLSLFPYISLFCWETQQRKGLVRETDAHFSKKKRFRRTDGRLGATSAKEPQSPRLFCETLFRPIELTLVVLCEKLTNRMDRIDQSHQSPPPILERLEQQQQQQQPRRSTIIATVVIYESRCQILERSAGLES